MPAIRLPDGSVRQFDQPASVAQIAASIGPGLAKAALAGKVDGKLVDTSYVVDRDAVAGDRHRPRSRGPRGAPPLDRAPARLRGQGAVPRRAGDDRPGDRGRLLLRLRLQAPVHARGPRGDRDAHGRTREEGRARRAHGDAARRRGEVLRGHGRALQGRDHRVDPVERADLALPRGRLHRPLPRPARAVDRQAARLQADQARRRLLARRLAQRDAAADLRHRLGEEGGPRGLPAPDRGGGEARPPQARARARPLPPAGRGARHGVLAPEGLVDLAVGRAVHAARLPGPRLPGGARARRSWIARCGSARGTGRTSRRTCSSRSRRSATSRSSR